MKKNMNIQQVIKSFCFLFLTILAVGCTPTVLPENVYHSEVDTHLSGSKNIVVEQTNDGLKVSGPDLALIVVSENDFKITPDPKGAKINYKMKEMVLAPVGVMVAKASITLGTDSVVAANLPLGQMTVFPIPYYLFGVVPGSAGSQNISVKVNKDVSHTDVAGLSFKQDATLNVWADGTVEVDKEGILAKDKDGKEWVSKKVKIGDKVAIIMIKNS